MTPALVSVHQVNGEMRIVFQDDRSVRNKNRKSFMCFFFPVGDHIESIVAECVGFAPSMLP